MTKLYKDKYGVTFKNGKPYCPKDLGKTLKNICIYVVEKLLLPIVIPLLTTVITNYYLNN